MSEGESQYDRPFTPYEIVWKRTSPGHRLLYYIYVIPFLLIPLIILGMIFTPIFLFFPSSRPLLRKGDEPNPRDPSSKYEWYGPNKDYPPGLALAPVHLFGSSDEFTGKGRRKRQKGGPGLHRRLWEMYGYFRETGHMIAVQGLQVAGVIIGATLLVMQIEMMWHDYTADSIVKYTAAVGSGDSDSSDQLKSDDKCAYATGTGVANWATGQEPLAWYGCYHGLMCIMLIFDETFNVRFGCFAPQWNRAGIGYTIMFLVAATQSTGANWGITDLIQLRYTVLTFFFLVGVYNVLRTLFANGGLTTDGIRHTDYRVGRKPLRLWTDSEWSDGYYRQNFIPYSKHNRKIGYDRYFWTERVQARIGDWNFPLERRPREDIERERDELEAKDPLYDDGRIQKVFQREPYEYKWQRGKMGRAIWHGGPKKMPYFMTNDLKQRERCHLGPLNPDDLPTEEEEKEMIKMLDEDKGYFGIANWKPVIKSWGWWWFDVRRVACIIVGFALMSVRIGLCIFDLTSTNLAAYNKTYASAKSSWSSSGGSDPTLCQYYEGSSLAIFIVTGGSTVSGVTANMIWLGIWHSFLIGMCVSVILVATSNNMFWGMHWPFPPITLIGPRMTSLSMGITIAFVSFATLQQGFFFDNSSLILITRIICYAGVVLFIISWFPNEPLRANYTRDPFWPWLSRYAFRFMDRKKWHYDFKDAEDAAG